jgi:putative transposase
MTRFIDAHRERFGVAPICRALGWCESTYYNHKARPPSDRALRDDWLRGEIRRVYDDNYKVYGARKVWIELRREGIRVARCTVERLMREMGLEGARRGGNGKRTTKPDAAAAAALPDLVDRCFEAERPNQVWVADLTYVATAVGFVYAAFVTDVFSRMIVGWAVGTSQHANLPLAALDMAMWRREPANLEGLVHHSDRGSQYTSVRYADRLDLARIAASVGRWATPTTTPSRRPRSACTRPS